MLKWLYRHFGYTYYYVFDKDYAEVNNWLYEAGAVRYLVVDVRRLDNGLDYCKMKTLNLWCIFWGIYGRYHGKIIEE